MMLRNGFLVLCKCKQHGKGGLLLDRDRLGYLTILNNVIQSEYSSSGKDFKSRKNVQNKKKALQIAKRKRTKTVALSELVLPEAVKINPEEKSVDETAVGEEIAGKLTKAEKISVMRNFCKDASIEMLAAQHGIEGTLFEAALQSFRKYCLASAQLPVEQHIVFRDLAQSHGHVSDLFPFFLSHAKTMFPHLDCMEDLKKISDLTEPSQWYPLARSIERKIVFHAGPTNSGKTYHALKRFMDSESGLYCGPLRLLAMEVFDKCQSANVPCDLITGETRRFANDDETPANHVSCTVEMTNLAQEYEVAVIDEIQMIGDLQRGWSWSRALLGVAAKEIHVCGEETAIDLVKSLVETIGDTFELRTYNRLTSLTYLDQAVESFNNIRKGDCIVCFSKRDIFKVFNVLEAKGHKCSVIYGDLPPGTKIMQSRKFNDPDDPCSVLVATDAVGMGLNLAIKRVIFYSVMKLTLREDHMKAIEYLSTSQAQQIGGRAGRYRTQFEDGEVTTFWTKDLKHLHDIVGREKNPIEKAGLHPSVEMIEMFSYHLPKASLTNLLDIFVHVSKMDESYFMCNLTEFKELAELIQHIPLPLRTRFTLCSSPLKVKKGLAQVVFVKIALRMSQGLPLTLAWLHQVLGAPFSVPKSVAELEHLEATFDVVDIYLWLSYRYPDLFVDPDDVRQLRLKLDSIIQAFLNKGSLHEKKRRGLNLDNLFGKQKAAEKASKKVAEEADFTTDLDSELLKNNPLQSYTPKPKPKTDDQKHKVFTDAYRDLETIEMEFVEKETKCIHEINEKAEALKRDHKHVTVNKQDVDVNTNLQDTAENQEEIKDIAEELDDGEVIEDIAVEIDAENDSEKTEHSLREGFLSKNTAAYYQLTGKYNLNVNQMPPRTARNDEIRSIASKFGLDEAEFSEVLSEAMRRKENKGKVGMNEKEMNQLKDMLTSMKVSKHRKPDNFKDGEDSLMKYVKVYPEEKVKPKMSTDSILHEDEEDDIFSFSNRFAVLSESGLSEKHDQIQQQMEQTENSSQNTDSRFINDTSKYCDSRQNTVTYGKQSTNIDIENSEGDSLEEKLLRQGVLTRDVLDQLKEEWTKNKGS